MKVRNGNYTFDGSWDQMKATSCEVGINVLGFKFKKNRDWFDENDASITKPLKSKNC